MNLRPDLLELLREARRNGGTLREVAAEAGIHVSTLCRWQARHPDFKQLLDAAAGEARLEREPAPRSRPSVRWRKDCPHCRARVVVRKTGAAPFWRCGRWPNCAWASWRPRAVRDCPRCGSPRFWSHSRMSVACPACGLRTKRPLTTKRSAQEMNVI